jgi:hypothetical protein
MEASLIIFILDAGSMQNVQRQMVGWLVSEELESIMKDLVVA